MKDNGVPIKSFIIGVAAGGAAGAFAGLLLAPKSGKELRHDIAVRKERLVSDANKKIRQTRRDMNEIILKGRNRTEELLEDSKMKLDQLKKRAGELISSGKETISLETNKLKDALRTGIEAYKDERKKVHNN